MAALTVFLPLFFAFVPTAKAAGGPSAPPPPISSNPTPIESDYWKACAFKVAYNAEGNGLDICDLSLTDSNGNASFLYGATASSTGAFAQAVYQTEYGKTPPDGITLLDANGSDTFTIGQSTGETLSWNNLSYASNSYTVSGTDSSGTKKSVTFYVYQPGPVAPNASNYSLLASINSDKSLHILAMVYNVPTNNVEFAAPIDKVALGSTSTGGLCTTASEASCGPASIYSATVNNPTSACVTQSNIGLEWLLCPLVNSFDKAADSINGEIENQLNFNINQNLADNGPVHFAWSIIKDIASSLVVILLLVMVIAQAFGGGPFEAYTIRKMLPKLVVAVIAMQLSWDICKYFIELANAAGQGIASILTLPFTNSPGALTLNGILTKLSPSNFTATQAALPITFIALGFIGLVALPTTLVMLFGLLVGIFAALMVLLFRNVLIVALVLFSSLAFLAWTMNGTQNLWKTWRSNFGKLLMLFPVIISIIYVGRIFAWIAAGASGNGVVKWLTVIIAYFGPYFIIFKAYKWGGGLLSAAGNGINNAANRVNKGAEEPIRGWAQRKQGEWAKKLYDPEAGLSKRIGGRILSGHVLPSRRSQRLAIAAGDKWQQERDEEALALINRKGERARAKGYDTARRDGQGRAQAYVRDARGNLLDKNNRITTDQDKAATRLARQGDELAMKHLTGVGAMKQMWIDLAEDGRDDHEKKMAVKQLLATSSWPEVQGSFTKSGRKVYDTDIWNPAVTSSQEDYPKILRSRVDATPHIMDSAEKAAVKQGFHENDQSLGAREFKAAYRMNYALEKQMSNEDFATQSDGFWEEAARLSSQRNASGNLTDEAIQIRTNLKKRLRTIQDAGPTLRQTLLGHLANGGVTQDSVNAILGGETIQDYLNGRVGVRVEASPPDAGGPSPDFGPEPTPTGPIAPAGPGSAGATVSVTSEGGVPIRGAGEGSSSSIRLRHQQIEQRATQGVILAGPGPTQMFERGTEEQIQNWVNGAGGYDRLGYADLVRIYNNSSLGDARNSAREELENRKHIEPRPYEQRLPGQNLRSYGQPVTDIPNEDLRTRPDMLAGGPISRRASQARSAVRGFYRTVPPSVEELDLRRPPQPPNEETGNPPGGPGEP